MCRVPGRARFSRQRLVKVGKLQGTLRNLPGDLVDAGDMNSRAIEWGMPMADKCGRMLLEMAAKLGLAVVNIGQTSTYRRPGFGYSIPDATMVTDSILPRIGRCRVIEDFRANDHQHIAVEVAGRTRRPHMVGTLRVFLGNAAGSSSTFREHPTRSDRPTKDR